MKKNTFCFLAILFSALQSMPLSGQVKKTEKIQVTSSSQEALQHYYQAMNAIENAELATFMDHMNLAIQNDANFFMPYYELAITYNYLKDNTKFQAMADKAINCKAKLTNGELLLKDGLARLKNNSSAVDIGKKLVQQYPNDKQSYLNLAFYCNASNDLEGAVRALKEGIEKAENPASLYNMLGYYQIELKNFDEAEKAFDKYIELVPNHPNPYDSKGDYYMAVMDCEKAYHCYMESNLRNAAWGLTKAMKAKKRLVASAVQTASPRIEGTWQMVEATYKGKDMQLTVSLKESNCNQIKIWTGNYFICNGRFLENGKWMDNFASGPYLINGNLYEETIQYHADKSMVGARIPMLMELKGDTLYQSWPADAEGRIDKTNFAVEKYVRVE